MVGAIPPLSLYACMAWTGVPLSLPCFAAGRCVGGSDDYEDDIFTIA
jgi:hypothetical protein